jgi:hypothetical protein
VAVTSRSINHLDVCQPFGQCSLRFCFVLGQIVSLDASPACIVVAASGRTTVYGCGGGCQHNGCQKGGREGGRARECMPRRCGEEMDAANQTVERLRASGR